MLDTVVLDISIGGLGVLAYSQDVNPKEGDVCNGCRLSLPEAGNFAVSLRIRSPACSPVGSPRPRAWTDG